MDLAETSRVVVEVVVSLYYLKRNDGKYHIVKRTEFVPPISYDELQVFDTEEEAERFIRETVKAKGV